MYDQIQGGNPFLIHACERYQMVWAAILLVRFFFNLTCILLYLTFECNLKSGSSGRTTLNNTNI